MVNRIHISITLLACCVILGFHPCFAQPANDNCNAAAEIVIPNSGLGVGVFSTVPVDIRTATVQPGEYFYPIITNNLRSVWYYFTISTNRRVDIRLAQSNGLPSSFVGMTVYQNVSCPPFPGVNAVLADLTRNDIGLKFRGCLAPGTYYIQVSANNNAFLDNIFLDVTISPSSFNNSYDLPASAYDFQTFSAVEDSISYIVGCQSIDNTSENVCTALPNSSEYTQSTWHTFTTDNHIDIFNFLIEPTGSSPFTTGSFGYNLYEGNIRTTPVASLTLIDGCAMLSYPNANEKEYICGLKPNTTYSIQLLFHESFNHEIKLRIKQLGSGLTQAPVPVAASMAPGNRLGVLGQSMAGWTYTVNDHLACNARLTEPSVQCGTVNVPGGAWDLSTWVSFELNQYINLDVIADQPGIYAGSDLRVIIYSGEITSDCNNLTPANIYSSGLNQVFNECMPPGKYSMQILGRSLIPTHVWDNDSSNFGRPLVVRLTSYTMRQSNLFNLDAAASYNQINSMQPLNNAVIYTSFLDMFGCEPTVLPQGATTCDPDITRGMYRILNIGHPSPTIPDSGILTITDINVGNNSVNPPHGFHRLYQGNASNLAVAQNAFTYPNIITGLTPVSACIDNSVPNVPSTDSTMGRFCLTPGTYTFATFGGNEQIPFSHAPGFRFTRDNRMTHNSPANAENLGTLSLVNAQVTSSVDYFTCLDNPAALADSCVSLYNKVIYREFFLQDTAALTILTQYAGAAALLKGRVSAGVGGLTTISPTISSCDIDGLTGGSCTEMVPGWYTILSLANGASYTTNSMFTSAQGGAVGDSNQVIISVAPVFQPKYNRPYKACDAGTLTWGPNTNTADYPDNDRTYPLCIETFGCDADTPFSGHPFVSCMPNQFNRTAYYVFSLSQPSFVVVDNVMGAHLSYVFGFDVRTDSTKMMTVPPIQPCFTGESFIQLCNLQPGTYTLLVLANDQHMFQTLQPFIYIDSVGLSKYDHASRAYDFGVITANSGWYDGQNRLNSVPGLAPSNDFFFCTTGAQPSDPDMSTCYDNTGNYEWVRNNNIYPFRQNYNLFNGPDTRKQPRRNLWYTFVLDKKGTCSIQVDNMTPNRSVQYPFAVFQSNGGVDSTYAQGLTYVGSNTVPNSNPCAMLNTFTFSACDVAAPTRYYVIIDNPSSAPPGNFLSMRPNNQLEVMVKHDSINVRYDHCYTANVINGLGQIDPPYTNISLPYGEFEGALGDFFCAGADPDDHTFGICSVYPFVRTLWYRFETHEAGTVRIAFETPGSQVRSYNQFDIMLLRDNDTSVLDCSASGLTRVPLDAVANGVHNWGEGCFSPGVYYLMLPGCSFYSELTPVVQLTPVTGDFCSSPGVVAINGVGAASSTLTVDCHTMGADFGEDGQNLLCMAGTAGYKSSWFRVDLTGPDKYNVEFRLDGTVNMSPVSYRVLYGNCGNMSVDPSSCSSLHNGFTLECLYAGTYYVQVFSPINAQGDVALHVTSTENLNPTCSPVTANFSFTTRCSTDTVYFMNYSAGVNLKYEWTFGSASFQSSDVNPWFVFPRNNALQNIPVTLTATDTVHSVSADTSFIVTVYPSVSLGNDTTLCAGDVLTLSPYPGGSFTWSTGATGESITITSAGLVWAEDPWGCRDSMIVSFISAPVVNLSDHAICPGDSITLDAGNAGASYRWSTGDSTQTIRVFATGTYSVSVSFALGCSTIGSSVVTVLPLNQRTRDVLICAGDSFAAGGGIQTASGTYYDTIPSATGCDSVLITNLTVSSDTVVTIDVMICNEDSFFAGGAFQTMSGVYRDTFGFGGCDSIVVTNLAVLPQLMSTIDVQICDGESYPAGGAQQTIAGTYYDTLVSATGCDSVVTTHLTILPTFTATIDAEICNGESYSAGGTQQTAAGIYYDTLASTSGCDSVIITNLTVKPNAATTINTSICSGDSFYAGGAFQFTTGIYIDSLNAANGCDSIVTTNLTIIAHSATTVNIEICDGQTYFAGGNFQTEPGTYSDTFTAQSGCDSIVTTILLVHDSIITTRDIRICDGDSFPAGGAAQTTSGTYYDTLTAANGCDSVLITNLTVLNHALTTITHSLCDGDSIFAGSAFRKLTGTYYDTLTAQNTCDSIVITHLTILDTAITYLDTTVCAGVSVFAGGALQTTTGTYYDSLTGNNGCDSVVITHLTILQHTDTTITAQICAGDSFYAGGVFQTTSGVYLDTLQAQNSCDSIVTTNLVVLNMLTTTFNVQICNGENHLAGGALQTTSGAYYDTLSGQGGCDSIVITNLTVLNHSAVTRTQTICDGDSVFAGGVFQKNTGTYVDTFTAFNGCDSIVTTHLSVLSHSATFIDTTICSGDSILAGGTMQTASGTYYDTVQAANGCDSIIATTLSVTSVPAGSVSVSDTSLCIGETVTITANGGTRYLWITGDTTASITITPSANGIISVEILLGACSVFDSVPVVVNPPPPIIISNDTAVCAGLPVELSASGGMQYLWNTNDNTQNITATQPGAYIVSVTDGNGCSSVDSVLISNHPVVSAFPTFADPLCADEYGTASITVVSGTTSFAYQWSNGYTQANSDSLTAGTYSITITDAKACSDTIYFQIVSPDSLVIEDITATDITCYGYGDGTLILAASGGSGDLQYSIDGGLNFHDTNTFGNLPAGEYPITVMDSNGCTTTGVQSFSIDEPAPIEINLVPDSSQIQAGESIELIATVSNNAREPFTFRWTPEEGLACSDCSQTFASPLETTMYNVEVTDAAGCVAAASAIVLVTPDDNILYIPNAFTPNGDGVNDEFRVYGSIITDINLKIFDRWGEKIFETDNLQTGWDGTFRGVALNPGVYVYLVDIKFVNNLQKLSKGSVTLIR